MPCGCKHKSTAGTNNIPKTVTPNQTINVANTIPQFQAVNVPNMNPTFLKQNNMINNIKNNNNIKNTMIRNNNQTNYSNYANLSRPNYLEFLEPLNKLCCQNENDTRWTDPTLFVDTPVGFYKKQKLSNGSRFDYPSDIQETNYNKYTLENSKWSNTQMSNLQPLFPY